MTIFGLIWVSEWVGISDGTASGMSGVAWTRRVHALIMPHLDRKSKTFL